MSVRLATLPSSLPVLILLPAAALAQNGSVKLAVGNVGIGIGDVRRLDGLRINFRDRHLERIRGLNATLWAPHDGSEGRVIGIALGLPLTGGTRVTGLALGAGFFAEESFDGVAVAALGLGVVEGPFRGVGIGGLGLGAQGDLEGIMISGVGLGTGGSIRGVAVGGIGAGSGGDVQGLAIGGLGVGAGGDVSGLILGGVGAGAGGDVRGIAIGGVGVGAGRNVTGVVVGGIGVGAGGEIRGLAIAGVGVGAQKLTGLTVAGVGAGGLEVTGLVLAPAFFQVEVGGTLRGVSVSAVNRIRASRAASPSGSSTSLRSCTAFSWGS